jgi:hypothetical protein
MDVEGLNLLLDAMRDRLVVEKDLPRWGRFVLVLVTIVAVSTCQDVSLFQFLLRLRRKLRE